MVAPDCGRQWAGDPGTEGALMRLPAQEVPTLQSQIDAWIDNVCRYAATCAQPKPTPTPTPTPTHPCAPPGARTGR